MRIIANTGGVGTTRGHKSDICSIGNTEFLEPTGGYASVFTL